MCERQIFGQMDESNTIQAHRYELLFGDLENLQLSELVATLIIGSKSYSYATRSLFGRLPHILRVSGRRYRKRKRKRDTKPLDPNIGEIIGSGGISPAVPPMISMYSNLQT
jgi:hypothetical protein